MPEIWHGGFLVLSDSKESHDRNGDSGLNSIRIIGFLLRSADIVLTQLFRRYCMSAVSPCFYWSRHPDSNRGPTHYE